jgi:hypothetical protein
LAGSQRSMLQARQLLDTNQICSLDLDSMSDSASMYWLTTVVGTGKYTCSSVLLPAFSTS